MKMTKLKTKKLLYVLTAVLVLAISLAGYGFVRYSHTKSTRNSGQQDKVVIKKDDSDLDKATKYIQMKDNAKALEYARKALAKEPNSDQAIFLVASLTKDPEEAKRLNAHELDLQKKRDNPDEDGKKAPTYWAAAHVAEQAGQKDQAKKYYQKVIQVANPADSYEQHLAMESQEAIKRLQ